MRRAGRLRVAILAFAVGVGAATTARAADKKTCVESAERGQDLRDRGKLVEAKERFLVCADPGCPAPVPTYCAEWLDDVQKRIPTLSARVTDADGRDRPQATVTVDGKKVAWSGRSIDLDPGTHEVRADDEDGHAPPESVVLAAGEKSRMLTLRLETSPAPTPASDVTLGGRVVPKASWVAWGIGAVGLLGFAVFGIKANIDYGNYKSSCGNQCSFTARDSVEHTMVAADTFLVVGIVAAAVGTVLYFVNPGAKPAPRPESAR